jgi:hypothetical protein
VTACCQAILSCHVYIRNKRHPGRSPLAFYVAAREGLLRASCPSPLRRRRCATFQIAPGDLVEPSVGFKPLSTIKTGGIPNDHRLSLLLWRRERDYSGLPALRPFGAVAARRSKSLPAIWSNPLSGSNPSLL